MIAADSSSLIAYFSGAAGADVLAVDWALEQKILVLPPPVLTEVLSDRSPIPLFLETLKKIPILAIDPNYWERSGSLRASLIRKGFRPSLSDTWIAQSCLDYQISLITRDRDFESFRQVAGLKLFQRGQ